MNMEYLYSDNHHTCALLGILAPVLLALLFQHSKDTEGPGEPPVVQGEGGMIHVY